MSLIGFSVGSVWQIGRFSWPVVFIGRLDKAFFPPRGLNCWSLTGICRTTDSRDQDSDGSQNRHSRYCPTPPPPFYQTVTVSGFVEVLDICFTPRFPVFRHHGLA